MGQHPLESHTFAVSEFFQPQSIAKPSQSMSGLDLMFFTRKKKTSPSLAVSVKRPSWSGSSSGSLLRGAMLSWLLEVPICLRGLVATRPLERRMKVSIENLQERLAIY